MIEKAARPEAELWLREQIDELATKVVLDGTPADIAVALAQLSERAGQSGMSEAARKIFEAAERVRGAAGGPELLSEEIIGLQQALLQRPEAAPAAAAVQPDAPAAGASSSAAAAPAARPAVFSPAQDPELLNDFILESREHLTSIENRMLVLEQNPSDLDAVHSVFRGFHTIKGMAGFLELEAIQEVAHEVETLLDLARDSKLAITPGIVDVVLAGADYLKNAINGLETALASGGAPPQPADRRGLVARIHQAMAGNEDAAAPAAAVAVAPVAASAAETESAAPGKESRSGGGGNNRAVAASSVRVETGKLDYLLDMMGELVIAQSLVRHNPSLAAIQDPRLQGDLSQLARITGEVQRTAMGMRMVLIGQVFQRMARLVRDLSRKAGKLVDLETSGEDTELDKTIAEELADPLMHMVRNAIDHGIESPEERAKAGKTPAARLRLAAYHQGGQIVVEISDDGRGLNREKILKKARQNGLVEEGAQLSETDIFYLIFEPGFSTAEQITDISGRGVGMDVVRKQVQKLRGRIDIQSKMGQGTTFSIKLPLTLAIIEGLVVAVGAHRYIVPIFTVREMFRPTPDAISTIQERDEMALVRGRLLPIVRLHRRLGVKPRTEDPCQGLLVVIESEGRQFCVLVDDLVGKQEVVIKSLGESLKNVPGISGGAILGDGRVGLILDMQKMYQAARHE